MAENSPKKRPRMKNPLRYDPTRTGLLRRTFQAEMNRRLLELKRAVWQAMTKDDILGLRPPKPFSVLATSPPPKAFQFKTMDEKLRAFNRWFGQMVNLGVLEVTRTTRPWLSRYVESAYKKGALRAYIDTHPRLGKSQDYYQGSREQFLKSAFDSPERVSKIRLIYTRAYEELKGVTAEMSKQISRVLADGLAHGKGPYDMARTMSRTITGISRRRANVLCRTEVIHAHAEGQLDGFEDLGIEEIGVEVEWSTASDDQVCPHCQGLHGKVFTIKQARGLIPLHPNCRCAWVPYMGKLKKGA